MIEAIVKAEPGVLEELAKQPDVQIEYGALGNGGRWEPQGDLDPVLNFLQLMGFNKLPADNLNR